MQITNNATATATSSSFSFSSKHNHTTKEFDGDVSMTSTSSRDDEKAFSSKISFALSQLSSRFSTSINQAFQTVPATQERAEEVKELSVDPLAAYRKRHVLEANQKAIDRDMRILHTNQTQTLLSGAPKPAAEAAAQFKGFKTLGRNDYIEGLLNELDESDFDCDSDSEYDSDSDSDSDSDDDSDSDSDSEEEEDEANVNISVNVNVAQTPQPASIIRKTQSGVVGQISSVSYDEGEEDDDDADESSSDDDDDSDYDSSDYYSDSDDDSSIGSFDDMMSEMQKEMGFVVPDALMKAKMDGFASTASMDDASFCTAREN